MNEKEQWLNEMYVKLDSIQKGMSKIDTESFELKQLKKVLKLVNDNSDTCQECKYWKDKLENLVNIYHRDIPGLKPHSNEHNKLIEEIFSPAIMHLVNYHEYELKHFFLALYLTRTIGLLLFLFILLWVFELSFWYISLTIPIFIYAIIIGIHKDKLNAKKDIVI